jgi:hypothetical protein
MAEDHRDQVRACIRQWLLFAFALLQIAERFRIGGLRIKEMPDIEQLVMIVDLMLQQDFVEFGELPSK